MCYILCFMFPACATRHHTQTAVTAYVKIVVSFILTKTLFTD